MTIVEKSVYKIVGHESARRKCIDHELMSTKGELGLRSLSLEVISSPRGLDTDRERNYCRNKSL